MSIIFTDTFTGANSSPWDAAWATDKNPFNSYVEIMSNTGQMVVQDQSGAYARAILAGPAALVDGEVLFSFQWSDVSALAYLNVWLRGSGGWNNPYRPLDGFGLQLQSNSGTVSGQKVVAGVQTGLGSTTGVAVVTTAKQWLRLRVQGATLQAKVWTDGSSEPGAWEASYTDPAVSGAGRFYMSVVRAGSNVGLKRVNVDDFTLDDLVVPPPSGGGDDDLGGLIMGMVKAAPPVTVSGTLAGVRRFSAVVVDADAAAVVEIRSGGVSGPVLAPIRLTGAGTKVVPFGGDVSSPEDVYVRIVSGTPTVVVYEA